MSRGHLYTRERLTRAAECCASIEEVIAHFGTKPYPHLTSYLRRRFARFDIDISHFRPGRNHTKRFPPEPAALRTAVAESHSLAETLRSLGRPDNGSQRATLRAWISEQGLSTAHFLGQAHQRGKRTGVAKPAGEILVRRGDGNRTNSLRLRRALHEVGIPEVCASCGTPPEWRGLPMTLEVDHVNGDRNDDRRENLRLLCPNCHAITNTWCRGRVRTSSQRLRGDQ
ncbi:HNH endonuclease signature motif containing protein [Streptomyces goshikiensis]